MPKFFLEDEDLNGFKIDLADYKDDVEKALKTVIESERILLDLFKLTDAEWKTKLETIRNNRLCYSNSSGVNNQITLDRIKVIEKEILNWIDLPDDLVNLKDFALSNLRSLKEKTEDDIGKGFKNPEEFKLFWIEKCCKDVEKYTLRLNAAYSVYTTKISWLNIFNNSLNKLS